MSRRTKQASLVETGHSKHHIARRDLLRPTHPKGTSQIYKAPKVREQTDVGQLRTSQTAIALTETIHRSIRNQKGSKVGVSSAYIGLIALNPQHTQWTRRHPKGTFSKVIGDSPNSLIGG